MSEQNLNPDTPPATDAGQVSGNQPTTDKNAAAPDNNQAKAGENQDEQKTEISIEELNKLKRNAGRWEARLKDDRKSRRERRQSVSLNQDDTDPETLDALRDRDEKIEGLSSENFRLKTENKVRNIFDKEEYKDISSAVKRAIVRNPLGFTNPASKTVEDAIADIEDYLDDELDEMSKTGNTQLNPANNAGAQTDNAQPGAQEYRRDNTPPATGSGPSSPKVSVNEGIEGKVGPARSTAILNNILKGRK